MVGHAEIHFRWADSLRRPSAIISYFRCRAFLDLTVKIDFYRCGVRSTDCINCEGVKIEHTESSRPRGN